jgi:hypothetical protein
MTTRADLHAIVDDLTDAELERARISLESVRSPLERALSQAPLDDEPETDAERSAVQEARDSLARGERGLSLAELRRELGV